MSAATTMGTESHYPTPRSSLQLISRPATRTVSPPEVPVVTAHAHSDSNKPQPSVDAAHAARAAATLHTPSSSKDSTHDVPKLPVDITELLETINRNDFALTGVRSKHIPDLDLATWERLKEDYVDALDCRLEYLTDSNTLIVTYASGVHESFNFLFKPIAQIAEALPSGIAETNHDILLPSKSSVTPDFAFAQTGAIPTYHVVFECAWSQPEDKLAEKIKKYFTRDDISAVVSLYIRTSGSYERRKGSPPDSDIITAEQAKADRRVLLGPVIIDGYTWGPEINSISLTIDYPGNKPRQVFENLCPVAGRITEEQLDMHFEIDKAILILLIQAVTPQLLRDALDGRKFALDWPGFFKMLDIYQFTDAYDHYLAWARKPIPKRPREAAAEDLDDAAILQLLRPRPSKKVKVE